MEHPYFSYIFKDNFEAFGPTSQPLKNSVLFNQPLVVSCVLKQQLLSCMNWDILKKMLTNQNNQIFQKPSHIFFVQPMYSHTCIVIVYSMTR